MKTVTIPLKKTFEATFLGETITYRYLILTHYQTNGALGVMASPVPSTETSDILILSVNLDHSDLLKDGYFAMHSTDIPQKVLDAVEAAGIAEPTDETMHSGFVDFPIWKLAEPYAKRWKKALNNED